ncbi:cytochrome P450 [Aspergillus homomorphus CBS 101889]|uniref:Putative cytochrome P450 oxidoreductase OrdA-like protein n=1 Tax=Aspergillus homomorphus (strain CBS 101889) TaxID=1450537 RepID=A0A395I5G8_ASPHC|nr:putative cytochrome P450 oxidoreductase OrdA-like protein [Aspergillus homomorphus CBS 101889]RAL15237.1 putative cytochrome P450 oxidoreductase OrdA-like protein [Aspergillus homomorphus CBS 101889]
MSHAIGLFLSSLALLILYLLFGLAQLWTNKPPLPPGPRRIIPWIGNLDALPRKGQAEHLHWLRLSELYGPISSVTVMGQTFVVLNDVNLAFEMLEKRGAIYSSRPRQVFCGEMVGWAQSVALSPYSDRLRVHRKNIMRILGSCSAAAQFEPMQEKESARFLSRVLQSPGDLIDHIRSEAGSLILNLVYGYNSNGQVSDPLIGLAHKVMEEFGQASRPGDYLVDLVPCLRNLTDWVPGLGFARISRQWRINLMRMADLPYAFVEHQLATKQDTGCFLAQLIQGAPDNVSIHKWTALSLYSAGADTTVSALSTFILAMTLNPEVQRKAQAEIDEAIHDNRLPTFADRSRLPYVNALVKEVLRWHPVTPMALPHTNVESDVFHGYWIPKGAIVLPNVWAFMHDTSTYPDPIAFKPERFLSLEGQIPELDPRRMAFGFGRRICPGRVLAESSIFIIIAQFLAVFRLEESQERTNERLEKSGPSFQPGVISHPVPFDFRVRARSARHEALIRGARGTHPWSESDAHTLTHLVA